eukprot:2905590-Pleurochrysis_carterae.AAC.1
MAFRCVLCISCALGVVRIQEHSVRRSCCEVGVDGGAHLQAVATAALRKLRQRYHSAASDDAGAARAVATTAP